MRRLRACNSVVKDSDAPGLPPAAPSMSGVCRCWGERWCSTDGSAQLAIAGARMLEMTLAMTANYSEKPPETAEPAAPPE